MFSVIVAVVSALIIMPYVNKSRKDLNFSGSMIFLAAFAILLPCVFLFYYVTLHDRNFSSLWPLFIMVTFISAYIVSGAESMLKSGLFAVSVIIGVFILAAPFFNAEEKYEQANMDVETEISAFDETKTPASVPPQYARNKMQKSFGQVPNTSYYQLGDLQIQKVNGDYVYIAPVEFSGLFKWIKGKETPGYFRLSATDSAANPVFIESPMTYTPSSFYNKDVHRHIWLKYPRHIFYGQAQLEVDEDGKPFYIQTYGNFISVRNGFSPMGIIMVDPTNGETKEVPLPEVPDFIDGAVSPESVSLRNSYYGKYVHGFWNSMFGKQDVKFPSNEGTEDEVSPVFDENGVMYYFTDFTSPKEDVDSMLGYSLTNARTGKATFYTGSQKNSYMDSLGALQIIEKKFIEKEWMGEMPILYNFYGEASWLTPVLDTNGFLQNYFIVSAANPEISAYAGTPNAALKQYKIALQRGGSSVNGSSKANQLQTAGSVIRVYKERTESLTVVSFLLNNGKNFIVTSETSPLSIYLKEGDSVIVNYLETGEIFLPVTSLEIQDL
ncbi:hypothetical protein P9E76_05870 [Schinkia azotoformans]|uniref:Uncharacterized protein n=1 Tax=Schinkia azotoformans LMG 9581 TaxID=1131731 RepID=K6CUY7_SCHAZ|nr:hypothetical protein [Schinkia azotoformans]EKN64022.1 hypothetical protein BAZO_15214 [Schinkia azotoformans LMG 9581]MEC1640545.1 hypothetical protein [Schinkia azotoformans]MEC1944570.1 hypothetical protein [Schinkia azotoformans]